MFCTSTIQKSLLAELVLLGWQKAQTAKMLLNKASESFMRVIKAL